MERKGKRVVAGAIGGLVGAALVAVGVWVWMDGNTGFGGAAIAIGAIIWIGWLSDAIGRRRKGSKA